MLYIDSNIFLYPVIYDGSSVAEAKRARNFLSKVALGDINAYTSHLHGMKLLGSLEESSE